MQQIENFARLLGVLDDEPLADLEPQRTARHDAVIKNAPDVAAEFRLEQPRIGDVETDEQRPLVARQFFLPAGSILRRPVESIRPDPRDDIAAVRNLDLGRVDSTEFGMIEPYDGLEA